MLGVKVTTSAVLLGDNAIVLTCWLFWAVRKGKWGDVKAIGPLDNKVIFEFIHSFFWETTGWYRLMHVIEQEA